MGTCLDCHKACPGCKCEQTEVYMPEIPLKWMKFSENYPKCEWVWISDYSKVVLQHATNLDNLNHEKTVWAEASIIYPEVPTKSLHQCFHPCYEITCKEDADDGKLYCFSKDDRTPVKFCPFCGVKGKDGLDSFTSTKFEN